MDWQILVPFIPFFASFFGVLAAFFFQWLGRRYDRNQDRKKFLKDLKHELETVSSLLTGTGQLLPTDMWESGKSSGFLSLLSHEVKIKFAATYFAIGSHNYEAVKVRDVSILSRTTKGEKPKADVEIEQDGKTTVVESPYTFTELLWYTLSITLIETEKGLKKHIDDYLKEDIWE
ncbi:MAG: hypothetical protein WCD81_10265 [Candidatus Bathyarchaeia archaeon]